MTYNFQNLAIRCSDWQQMQHLAKIAEGQGKITDDDLFNEDDFNKGNIFFIAGITHYCTTPRTRRTPTTYTTFINSHPDVRVEGC